MQLNLSFKKSALRLFDIFVICISIASVMEVPILYAFKVPVQGLVFIFEFVVVAVFTLDIVRHFYFPGNLSPRWQNEKNRICTYLKGWFWVDFLAALPFTLFLSFLFPESYFLHYSSALYLLTAVKFLRVMQFANKVARRFSVNPSIIRLAIMFIWIVAIAHYMACIWSSLGYREENFTSSFDIYLRSYYFITTTIATVGYGDICPKTSAQTIFVIFVELVGAGIYGFVIGNIANVISSIDIAKTQYRERQERIDTFMKYRDIPNELRSRILEYYAYVWETRRGYDESTVFQDLPINLKTKLSLFLNRDLIGKVPLFKDATSELIRDLILKLEPIIFMPGDIIVEKGEVGYEMFFISKGSVDVVAEDGNTVYATLADGQFFGEIALLLSTPRTATIRASDYCDLYRLDKTSFDLILEKHQDFAARIRNMAEQRRLEIDAHVNQ